MTVMTRKWILPAIIGAAILSVGALHIPARGPIVDLLYVGAWIALLVLVAVRAFVMSTAFSIAERLTYVATFGVSTLLMVRYGGFTCWPVFRPNLCESFSGAPIPRWDIVYVNQDSFTYLQGFSSVSLRPPLYYWFIRASTLGVFWLDELYGFAQDIIPFESNPQALFDYLQTHPNPLVIVARAQQLALWSAVTAFVWTAFQRGYPGILVALLLLALYDGGVLTHWYYAHAIETKVPYLAAFFAAASASLFAMYKPTALNVLLTAIFCAMMPLIRPQGLIYGLLVALVSLRYLFATRATMSRATTAAFALSLFVFAALLPSVVTFVGEKIWQMSNTQAFNLIAFTLQLADRDDVKMLREPFDQEYLTAMIDKRDREERPKDLSNSLLRNQGIGVSTCAQLAPRDPHKGVLLCAASMKSINDAVLGKHLTEYIHDLVLPSLIAIADRHVGSGVWSFPLSMLLAVLLVGLLIIRIEPWIALWGATLTILHGLFLVSLAMTLGPYGSGYLLTSEPLLFSVLAVMLSVLLSNLSRTA
jgi:hypothetical protein